MYFSKRKYIIINYWNSDVGINSKHGFLFLWNIICAVNSKFRFGRKCMQLLVNAGQ